MKFSKILFLISIAIFTIHIIYFHLYRNEVTYAGIDSYGSVRVSNVVSVYDGDTFSVNINKWPAIIGDNISVRIRGIDAPEIVSNKVKVKLLAIAAKEKLSESLKSGNIVLTNIKRDKYFRIDADVFAGKKDVAKILLDSRLAKEYDGSEKPTWNEDDYYNYINVLNKR